MVTYNILQLDKNMKEIGKITISKGMEYFTMPMEINMKVIGSKIKDKEKEKWHLPMEPFIKVTLKMIIFKVMVE